MSNTLGSTHLQIKHYYEHETTVHVGELHWDTNPTDDGEIPEPNVTVEVDYHEHSDPALRDPAWREYIRTNYGIYGIDVTFDDRESEVITDGDLVIIEDGHEAANHTAPFDRADRDWIATEFGDSDGLYLFVGSEMDPDWGGKHDTGEHQDDTVLISVYTDTMVPGRAPGSASRDEKMRIVTAKNAVHEIGHVLNVGEADDDGTTEVYSGTANDSTHEYVNKSSGTPTSSWSVMVSGIRGTEIWVQPSGTDYTAFSIEELSTISMVDVERNNYD